VKFQISKRARGQIEKISRWWTENRPEAPTLVLDELDELDDAERRLRVNPQVGPLYARHRLGDVRRLLLASEYHLYDRYHRDRDELVVLALWGASRGRRPKL
jgi:plasmid stabilization system protein ParE